MTKTKRQLRAEAVENLKANSDWAWHDLADFFKASGLMDSPYNTPYRELRAALIDLLTDDCGHSADMSQKDTDCVRNDGKMSQIGVSANDVDANDVNVISENLGKSQDSEIESCRQYADQGERAESPDCESDSREKLEADVLEIARKINMTEDGIQACSKELNALLDRQAAITERECKERVDFSLITQTANALFPDYQERIAEMQEKVDALTQANADYREEWHRVCRERDDLQRKLHESNREREQLRKQLGIAIDHAHDMIALVSVDTDEGLA